MNQIDGFSIINQLDKGVSGERIGPLANGLGLRLSELAPLLSMSNRTLHRNCTVDSLNRTTAERLLLLEHLIAHGVDVFDGNTAVFFRWLHFPLGELAHKALFQLLTSCTGIRLVDDVLTRIDYGVYS